MIDEIPDYFYTILGTEHYETIDRYEPTSEYTDVLERCIDDTWKVKKGGYWTLVSPEPTTKLTQGWKIHLSASESGAKGLLERVVPILVCARVGFKFCADRTMLRLSTNKNLPRTGSAKFVTIYPANDEQLTTLLEELYQATRGEWGPFLLTDRAYKDSRVVYYRYGSHYGIDRINVTGRATVGILSPEGRWVPDDRRPYFHLPPWVKDPFAAMPRAPSSGPQGVLLKGRYRVTSAIRFFAAGGIYRAVDTHTDRPVIIREARPVGRAAPGGGGEEGFLLLEKEARILEKLGPTGYAPKLVDLFSEWEHQFLVQEMLIAESLWGYAMGFSRGSAELRVGTFFERIRDTIRKIAIGLRCVHEHGIVLRDLTRNNVMFTRDQQARFIDMEFAYELDRADPPVEGWTAGHSSPEQLRVERPTPAEDCYSLGALVLDQIAFTAPGLDLNRAGILASFRQTLEDYELPLELDDVVRGLLETDRAARWDIDRVLDALDAIRAPTGTMPLVPIGYAPPPRPAPSLALREDIARTVAETARYITAMADYTREDRLWPASAEVFATNPLGLLYGATGTAYFLHRAGALPDAAVRWMEDRLDHNTYPPGLFSGLSGIAWVLLELGRLERAEALMDRAAESDLLHVCPDLYFGDAGWGIANLRFWLATRRDRYLERALEAGAHLVKSRKETPAGVCWEYEGEVPLGLGHGQSGVALFLLYLNAARPGGGFLETAIRAIDFEIENRVQLDDEVLWFPRVGAPSNAPKSPHMRHGTAGVGTAVLLGYLATGDARLRRFADQCANTVADRHTNKLWFDYGLAGYGEFLLDMYQLLGDELYLNNAFHLAEALLPHRIFKEEGVAFAAQELFRISCDLGAGAAGIGLFLRRLLHPHEPRFLMLDELLPGPAGARSRP